MLSALILLATATLPAEQLVFGGFDEAGGGSAWLVDPLSEERRELRLPGELRALTFSADGGMLAALGGTRLTLILPKQDAVRVLAEDVTLAGAGDLEFSPGGEWLAVGKRVEGNFELLLLRTDGSARRVVAAGHAPVWSADGKRIAYLARPEDAEYEATRVLRVLDLTTDEDRVVADGAFFSTAAFSKDGRRVYTTEISRTYNTPTLWDGRIIAIDLEDLGSSPVTGMEGERMLGLSPDGKLLALLRKGEGRPTLLLHELESGDERAAIDALPEDLQGEFASLTADLFQWSPSGRFLLFGLRPPERYPEMPVNVPFPYVVDLVERRAIEGLTDGRACRAMAWRPQ